MHIMEERDDLEFLDVIIIIVGFAVIIQRFRSDSLDLWAFFGIFLFGIYLIFRIGGFLFNRSCTNSARKTNYRLRALIMTLKDSGLRTSDVVQLSVEDFLSARRFRDDSDRVYVAWRERARATYHLSKWIISFNGFLGG